MNLEAAIVFAAYCIGYGALTLFVSMLMYLLCEGIEKVIEILEGDVDG
jgi:hypothetical protein